ncbi:MAG: hypothetical protein ABFD91_10350 [Anaerohalosphaeraceae bacterium]
MGCRKKSEPGPSGLIPAEQAAKEKDFLSDPCTIVGTLDRFPLYELTLPWNALPDFIQRMEDNSRINRARIILDNHDYFVFLGDNPKYEFGLYDIEKQAFLLWWGSSELYSKHPINSKFYEFITLDNVTKIAARPYQGEMGILKISAGGRDLQKMDFGGSLRDASGGSAVIGNLDDNRFSESVTEMPVPVGDYNVCRIDITYDNLKIRICENDSISVDDQEQRPDKKPVYGITIRKDRPYILDLSTHAKFIFVEPSKEQDVFHPDDQILFAAVLADPKLDVMIPGIQDKSVLIDKKYRRNNGSIYTIKEGKPLDPNIIITRTDGEIVAEDTMPFC